MVGHTASIRGLRNQVAQTLPRNLFIGVQIQSQNVLAHLKVGVVEVVGNVETQGAKFASLQQNTMVEAQGEQQAAVLYFLGTAVEFLLRNEIVEPQQVVLQTLGRLCCDLDGSLQNSNGELGVGNTGEPQTEIGMDLASGQLKDYFFPAQASS